MSMFLPVEEILPQLCDALSLGHVVLTAPPGSGKTTRVPLALLDEPWLAGKKIIMLEPRRPAARMAAAFMSELLHEGVGQTVGYQVRMERRISESTRIEVLTEGLLVRRLQDDPELSGVGLVIFDEFHERSLQADLGLALCLDVCASLREDLRLLVMSATLDEQKVADLMGGEAVISDGGLHPVVVEHLARSAGQDLLLATARLVHRALREQPGDVLVFLPGKDEMARLQESLSGSGVEILQLHGEMDAATQSRVLRPESGHPRRVVLATDVAETSLTIEGITAVVDSGLSRKPLFDPDSGLSRLKLLPIAQASATQRAGRAGRLGPGVCYRAFTEQEFFSRPAQRPAEILQADLAPLVLELALWGVNDAAELSWLDLPPTAAWEQAAALLRRLDALDEGGRISAHGRRMARLGLHPRLAHLLLSGGRDNVLAADLAALLSERDPWRVRSGVPRPADLGLRLQELETLRQGGNPSTGIDAHACRRTLRLSERLQRQCRSLSEEEGRGLSAAALLSLAFPERIARRRLGADGRYLMASGRGAVLPADDGLAVADYLAIAQMDAGSREGRIWLAMKLDEQELWAVHGERITEKTELVWDAQAARVGRRCLSVLGALELSLREVSAGDDPAVIKRLLQAVAELGLDCLNWSGDALQLQARMNLARHLDESGGWPDVSDQWLQNNLGDWLAPWAEGMRSLKELRKLDLQALLQGLMTWEQTRRLDELLPRRWKLGDGSSAAIHYTASSPVLAVPLQLMFGMAQTPVVFRGRQPLLLHLLSPAGRPLQVTTDLAAFWADAWEQVKKEMRGRYPKHYWPDDPANAKPVRLKKNL
ncbi:ATP-dependent helicase HrpB [Thiolapillus sp.]